MLNVRHAAGVSITSRPTPASVSARVRLGCGKRKLAPVPSLTSVQAAALIVLVDHSPCSLTTLGRAAAMDPATTRGVAERLNEKGWVSLVPDSRDKRKVMVRLEKKGRQFALDLIPVLNKIADETLSPLNEAERVALVYLLDRIATGANGGEDEDK